MGRIAIRLDDVNVTRGSRRVVTDFTTEITSGSVVGLLGPSGCGKSTIMRSIVGVQRHVSGTVEVLGHPAGSPAVRRDIGYRSQDLALYDDLTVWENVEYFCELLGVDAGRGRELLGTVELDRYEDQRADSLSGGQRARLSLATAMVNDPAVLVLDEPTVGLDPVLRHDLWLLFAELARGGATLLVSSHVMDEAERCEQLLLMRDGRLLAAGSPRELTASTGTGTVEEAFLALVAGGGDVQRGDSAPGVDGGGS